MTASKTCSSLQLENFLPYEMTEVYTGDHSGPTDHKRASKAVDVPLVHVLGRPGSAKTGVEPTEIIETDLVQETSQGSHVESLGHLPETDEDCLEFKRGKS